MGNINGAEFVSQLETITAALGSLVYSHDVPQWLPNGEPITTTKQLALVMGIPESTAYLAALQSKNDHPVKDTEAQATADADNLYDHTHCHHTSIRRTLGIQPGQFILDTKGDRYVRTWKGVLRFGLPIGALIVPNVVRAPNQHAAQGREDRQLEIDGVEIDSDGYPTRLRKIEPDRKTNDYFALVGLGISKLDAYRAMSIYFAQGNDLTKVPGFND